jgi:phospholipase/lecithinase/hemolysin
MECWHILLGALGGAAAMLGAAHFLSKSLIGDLLAKDLKRFELQVKQMFDTETEWEKPKICPPAHLPSKGTVSSGGGVKIPLAPGPHVDERLPNQRTLEVAGTPFGHDSLTYPLGTLRGKHHFHEKRTSLAAPKRLEHLNDAGFRMKTSLALLVSVLAISFAETAAAQVFDQVIVFGDSTVDSGYYKALSNPGGGATFNADWPTAVADGAGKPTSSPGLMNSELLALYLGLTANASDQGGTNYATSGAKNVTVNNAQTGGFQAAIPTVTQIANYLAAHNGQANLNALYLISSGGNDVSYALGQSGTGPFPSDPNAYITSAANSLVTAIKSLQIAGAQHFIIPNLPFSFPTNDATTQAARKLYTDTLFSSLASQGVNVIQADYNSLRVAISNNPAQFGFTFTGTASGTVACTQPSGVTSAWALLCSSNPNSPSHFRSTNADLTSLFADDQHLATAGQGILASYYYSLIRPAGTLTVAILGSGTGSVTTSPAGINCSTGNVGTCSTSFPPGSSVTLGANVTGGPTFAGWGGDCAGAGTAQTCTLTLTGSKAVTATFNPAGPTGTASAFVTRLYQQVLNRAADPAGLQAFVDQIAQFGSVVPTVLAFFHSQEFLAHNTMNDQFLIILYHTFLDREPDPVGLNAFLTSLQMGQLTRDNLLDIFIDSQEFAALASFLPAQDPVTAFVINLYVRILGRGPDQAGLQGFVAQLQQTRTVLPTVLNFLHSPEFLNRNTSNTEYVTVLYRVLLNRVPDAGGLAGWVAVLTQGSATRDQLAAQFAASAEFQAIQHQLFP